MDVIRLEEIGLIKKQQSILQHITFTVKAGDFVGVAGSSGSGKSSLFRIMNGLQSATAGKLYYRQRELSEYKPAFLRRSIGYVLQKPHLFTGTVRDNLFYPYLVWQQKPDIVEIAAYLSRVNLTPEVLDKRGGELSGGEQQRIALVRSLLAKPEVLLLDEVSAALDPDNTLIVERLIKEEQARKKLTVFCITHSREQLFRLAETVLYLAQGQMIYFGPLQGFSAEIGRKNI